MESEKELTPAQCFALSLRACLEQTYCLGGASDDEMAAAAADFLIAAGHSFLRRITTDVEVPALR